MPKLLSLILSFMSLALCAQPPTTEDDFFKYYGPPGSSTYTSFTDAFKDAKKGIVYKLKTDQPAPKKLDKLAELTSLQILSISNNYISNLPANIGNLNSLVYFKSENNPLKTLPATVSGWNNLLYLKLYNTEIDTLPKDIGGFGRLKEFEWLGNKGDTVKLPQEIKYWRALKSLSIQKVVLDTLPNTITLLSELTELKLDSCGLNVLPHFWGEYKGKVVGFKKLESLSVSGNNLSSLPPTLWYCRKLRVLDLSDNKLTALPDDICRLSALEILDLRGNSFSPYQLAVLKGLLPNCRIMY
jgi:Leucine-rich repeat (LRR) protein